MDLRWLQTFMKGVAGEYTTSLVPQMKDSAVELLETT